MTYMLFTPMKKVLISRSSDKIFFSNPIRCSKKHRGAILMFIWPYKSLLQEASILLSYTITKMLRAQSSLLVITESKDGIKEDRLIFSSCQTLLNWYKSIYLHWIRDQTFEPYEYKRQVIMSLAWIIHMVCNNFLRLFVKLED